ncbi:MAG TPA: hypothetical protein VGF59_17035 [Bryobacteraceae bacterium]
MIALLNRYFVPVTSANETTRPNGPASPAEKAELRRIVGDFASKKLGTGDVHVYVLGPDRTSIGGLDIGSALKEEKMSAFLESVAANLHTAPGPPVIKPHPMSAPPRADTTSMVFHLVARGANQGSWREFPAENWIVLGEADWKRLLPPNAPAMGASWEVPAETAAKFYEWFYPQTEDPLRVSRSHIEQETMRMTIVTLDNGLARARIDGSLRMKHSFYPGREGNDLVTAAVIGFMDFDVGRGAIQRLRIVDEKAVYHNEAFGVALRSVSHETLEALGN